MEQEGKHTPKDQNIHTQKNNTNPKKKIQSARKNNGNYKNITR